MKSNLSINRRQPTMLDWLLVALAVIGVAVLVLALLPFAVQRAVPSEPVMPRGAPFVSWNENGQVGQYLLQILDGNAPPAEETVSGVVASDTACEPDSRGFNHCHNTINLADGIRIAVINTHVMRRHRCLAPGDKVSLTRINASWVIARLSLK